MKHLLTTILALSVLTPAVSGQDTDATVNWKTDIRTGGDGKQEIHLIGTPSTELDQFHGTLQWISCYGNNCHSPEEWEFSIDDMNAGRHLTETGSEGRIGSKDKNTAVPISVPEEYVTNGDYTSTEKDKQAGSLWALIIEAILWGFAMLLTPCVFPMVPMTVSFFLKGSSSKSKGKLRASMYGLFIILLYTVPICLIIAATYLTGGASVTADIFNWISTHWLPNLLFFIIFMVFAASFFGAFEITLPSKWTNGADNKSMKAGLGGVFFMALTLVLVSFSCTGPIVGTVLIKSTQGEFWAPMVAMLAFSTAFALPFTILALFPTLIEKLPKSGGWLNSVKVTLGFIEVALGFKFLSVADQTYHWGILDREVYLAIWIVCFALLGLYLLGKLRFKNDSPLEYISVKRLALAIADLAFVVYLIPGMWGAPLKALSGYLPPMETMDTEWVTGVDRNAPMQMGGASGTDAVTGVDRNAPMQMGGAHGVGGVVSTSVTAEIPPKSLKLPHQLTAYDNIEDAVKAAGAQGKPIFVDITGHGCVNCREMEARVWSDPEVLSLLRQFIIVALYTDDKTPLPESKWQTAENGKVLKDVGRVNSYIVRKKFGVNAQPNYVLLDNTGRQIAPVRGYDLNVKAFAEFLKQALDVHPQKA